MRAESRERVAADLRTLQPFDDLGPSAPRTAIGIGPETRSSARSARAPDGIAAVRRTLGLRRLVHDDVVDRSARGARLARISMCAISVEKSYSILRPTFLGRPQP